MCVRVPTNVHMDFGVHEFMVDGHASLEHVGQMWAGHRSHERKTERERENRVKWKGQFTQDLLDLGGSRGSGDITNLAAPWRVLASAADTACCFRLAYFIFMVQVSLSSTSSYPAYAVQYQYSLFTQWTLTCIFQSGEQVMVTEAAVYLILHSTPADPKKWKWRKALCFFRKMVRM